MKTVYFLRAMAGHGASTFVSENGLLSNSLSYDTFNNIFNSRSENNINRNPINSDAYFKKSNKLAYDSFMLAFNHKSSFGELIIIDALNYSYESFKKLADKSISIGYDVKVVDFKLEDFSFYLNRNKNREPIKQIDEVALGKIYGFFKNPLNSKNIIEKYGDFITPEQMLSDILISSEEVAENNQVVANTYCFGDIHGCFDTLMKFDQDVGFNSVDNYIFLGDYIDRGDKCGEVYNFIVENIDKENFTFLIGNHEKSINDHYRFKQDNYFSAKTKSKINKIGINDDLIIKTYDKMKSYKISKIGNKKFIFSHGGVDFVPNRPELLTPSSYIFGSGCFNYNIDAAFSENHSEDDWFQVHGHRNINEYSCFTGIKKSISVECKVEFGGSLAVLKITPDGCFNGLYYSNDGID